MTWFFETFSSGLEKLLFGHTVNEWKHGAITVNSLISLNHTPQSG